MPRTRLCCGRLEGSWHGRMVAVRRDSCWREQEWRGLLTFRPDSRWKTNKHTLSHTGLEGVVTAVLWHLRVKLVRADIICMHLHRSSSHVGACPLELKTVLGVPTNYKSLALTPCIQLRSERTPSISVVTHTSTFCLDIFAFTAPIVPKITWP